MNDRLFIGGGLLLVGTLLAGCAGKTPDTVGTVCGSDYRCMYDRMFEYRRQAADLNVMAERYAREAAINAREFGQNSDQVKKSQELAGQFSAQAQEADQLAHEYSRRLPHNAY